MRGIARNQHIGRSTNEIIGAKGDVQSTGHGHNMRIELFCRSENGDTGIEFRGDECDSHHIGLELLEMLPYQFFKGRGRRIQIVFGFDFQQVDIVIVQRGGDSQ